MPHAKGAKNYKNDRLIPIVVEILPNGEFGWAAVALAYQETKKIVMPSSQFRSPTLSNLTES